MFRNFRRHLTYSNVVSTICLFVLLLGGGAYAATKLPKNSVGSKQIKDGAVQSQDVGDGALSRQDFAPGALPAGPEGPAGPAGSPDTPSQVRDKLLSVDGNGSGLDADTLDGKNSTDFMPSTANFVSPAWNANKARLGFEVSDVPAGDTQLYQFGIGDVAIHYQCPADPMATNGTATIDISGDGGNLFVDAGGENPTYTKVPSGGSQTAVQTLRTGEALTIQYQEGTIDVNDRLETIMFFSVGRPGLPGVNNGFCHVQGQLMDGSAQ